MHWDETCFEKRGQKFWYRWDAGVVGGCTAASVMGSLRKVELKDNFELVSRHICDRLNGSGTIAFGTSSSAWALTKSKSRAQNTLFTSGSPLTIFCSTPFLITPTFNFTIRSSIIQQVFSSCEGTFSSIASGKIYFNWAKWERKSPLRQTLDQGRGILKGRLLALQQLEWTIQTIKELTQ